jgi:predicted outer membrane repeat protein
LINNTAGGYGGGVSAWNAIVNNCRFEGNEAYSGGAFYAESTEVQHFSNIVFCENSGMTVVEDETYFSSGGAIYAPKANVTLNGSSIEGNRAGFAAVSMHCPARL